MEKVKKAIQVMEYFAEKNPQQEFWSLAANMLREHPEEYPAFIEFMKLATGRG